MSLRGYAGGRHSFDKNEAQASRLIHRRSCPSCFRPAFLLQGHVRLSRFVFLLSAFALLASLLPAGAVESWRVPPDQPAIDLTHKVENYSNQGDRIQVSTAPGADGIVRRIEVHAREQGAHPSWVVFALTNDTDEQMERLLVAPHFQLVGSGVIWPDLGSERIAEITPSQGSEPEKEDAAAARSNAAVGMGIAPALLGVSRPWLPNMRVHDPSAIVEAVASVGPTDADATEGASPATGDSGGTDRLVVLVIAASESGTTAEEEAPPLAATLSEGGGGGAAADRGTTAAGAGSRDGDRSIGAQPRSAAPIANPHRMRKV